MDRLLVHVTTRLCSPLALSPCQEVGSVVPKRRSAWLVVDAQVKACSRETPQS